VRERLRKRGGRCVAAVWEEKAAKLGKGTPSPLGRKPSRNKGREGGWSPFLDGKRRMEEVSERKPKRMIYF